MTEYTGFVFDYNYYKSIGIKEIGLGVITGAMPYFGVHMPMALSALCCAFMVSLGVTRLMLWKSYKAEIDALNSDPFFYVTFDELREIRQKNQEKAVAENAHNKNDPLIYFGRGYVWENKHAIRYQQLKELPEMSKFVNLESAATGLAYIHNIGVKEEKDILYPLPELMHSIFAGTTRVGKTRTIELLTAQIIDIGETLIIVDPKGDSELLDSVYLACILANRQEDFLFFSLAHPSKSCGINTMKSYLKPADLASRITSIMPQGGDSKPFTDFCWKVLVSVAEVMHHAQLEITIKTLHKYSLQSMDELHSIAHNKSLEIKDPSHRAALDEAMARLRVLINHPKDNFSKMINSLEPVMTALATGEVGELLSPNPESERKVITWDEVRKGKKIVYFYLASMIDTYSSSAVGKLVVQDLLNFVGQSYAFDKAKEPINLFIDEFYSVVFPGYVDLLNKAGGDNVRVFVALQTTADITSVTQASMTKQILGNINNKFYMRVPEKELAEEFCSLFGSICMKSRTKTRNIASDPKSAQELFRSGFAEREDAKEIDLIYPEAIIGLPKGQAYVYTQGRRPYKIRIAGLKWPEEIFKNYPKFSDSILDEKIHFDYQNIEKKWEEAVVPVDNDWAADYDVVPVSEDLEQIEKQESEVIEDIDISTLKTID